MISFLFYLMIWDKLLGRRYNLLFCEGNAELMTYCVHSPALDRLPTHNFAMSEYSDSFQKKMGSGDFANAINCHIPISYG